MVDARYPLDALESDAMRGVVAAGRRALAQRGLLTLPSFIRPDARARMVAEALELEPMGHLEDIWSTPYLAPPDLAFPPGHPRRLSSQSLTRVLACDLFPPQTAVQRLYASDAFLAFIAALLEAPTLYRLADPLGALNCSIMRDRHVQGWHFDTSDFVVSLTLAQSDAGGHFECASGIRSDGDEHYDAVAEVMGGGRGPRVVSVPMRPGTLMVFRGRYSLHRVTEVRGARPRVVALFAFDTRPGVDSNRFVKLARYGRVAPLGAGERRGSPEG